ncbi:MAG: DUF3718 domain-containing protein [Algicola sp.]|nr:DUF3718 domain-containing protein [Algicola sp.]
MKTTKSAIVLAVLGLSMATAANAAGVSVTGFNNSLPTQLCVTAATGSRVKMFKDMSNSGWSKQFIKNNIVCNGDSIGTFAAKYGSDGVKSLLPGDTKVEIIELSQLTQISGSVRVSK